ncbi:MAG: SDR family oxidoreductase [Hyphomicrobiaceae bacterium]|nr:SDR family oxidoreductase [Hyphomicrobiaceae bacterium]
MTQKLLIIGASRGIGLETVRAALAANYSVRAFARNISKITLAHENLEKVSGDALNADHIKRALEGIDVVIQTLGVSVNLQMVTGPINLFSNATRVLVSNMERAKMKRLIAVTGFGSGHDGRRLIPPLQRIGFEIFLGRVYSDKNIQENLIKASSLDWTIVRPGILTSGKTTGDYYILVKPENWRNGLISRADVADFIVKQIDNPTHIKQTPVLVGSFRFPHI